jgi:hypothetical protein
MANQRFIFSNGEKQIELQNIEAIEGLGLPPTELYTHPRGWRMDGANVQWSRYTERPFTIAFDFIGVTFEQVAAQRRELLRLFANKEACELICTREDGLVVTLTGIRMVAPTLHPLHEIPYMPEIMQFIAADPYFRREIPQSSMPLETARLGWPAPNGLSWLAGGIPFSIAEKEIMLTNHGDVYADAIIRFSGPATTPYVENLTTGQKLTVNRTLGNDDVLEINSRTGRVDIIGSDGTRNNAFNYITDDSVFLRYAIGQNIIEFGSAGGAGSIEAGGIEYYASL